MGKSKTRRNRPKPKHKNSSGGGNAHIRHYARLGKTVALGSAGNEMEQKFQEGQSAGFARALTVMLWTMHTEFGYGRIRLLQIMAGIADLCNEYILPHKEHHKRGEYQGMTVEDVAAQLFEETGIHIDVDSGIIRLADDKKPYRLTEDDGND